MKELVRAFAVSAALAAAPGCVDTSAVDYVAPPPVLREGGPGLLTDAGDGGVTLVEACRECMTEGPCKATTDACSGDPKCALFAPCTIDTYCLNFSFTDLAHLPRCLVDCQESANISGQVDPSVVVIAPFVACSHEPDPAKGCGPVCNVQ